MTASAPVNLRLDGRRALITGAGRGLGRGAAIALAEAGAEVVLMSRTSAEVEAAADEIRAAGGAASAVALDILRQDEFGAWAASNEPIDILVNNAGMNRPQPFLDVTTNVFDAIFELNVKAAFFTAQTVARRLVASGRPGSIVNMSSQMGKVGAARRTVYCASKWAMEGFTRAMAIELAPARIRVNTICPTFVETPMVKGFLEDEAFRTDVLAKIKLGRLGRVEDVTGAVLFLASEASAMMTGTSMVIDGGWTAE